MAAPIFELRRLRQDVPVTQWRGFVIDVYDYLVRLNNLQQGDYTRRKQAPAVDMLNRR